jgi:hemoglobin-like flavoprotein
MMTPRQIALVREGFSLIAPNAEAVGLAVYTKIFELDPSLRTLFAGDIGPQVKRFMDAVTMVVRSLDDLTPLLAFLRMLGRKHVAYGVKPKDLDTAAVALLATLEAGLGDTFTEEARNAWTIAYTTLAGAMRVGMDEMTAIEA